MTTMSFTEFRQRASGVLSEVEDKGEVFVILRHGKPVAEIGPVGGASAHEPAWRRPGLRLATPGAALAAAVLQERDES